VIARTTNHNRLDRIGIMACSSCDLKVHWVCLLTGTFLQTKRLNIHPIFMACRTNLRPAQLHSGVRSRALIIQLLRSITTTRCVSDDHSPRDLSQRAWTQNRATWISAARKEIKKSRIALNKLEKVLDELKKNQHEEEDKFRQLMYHFELREPKPEDYGLPRGWRQRDGPDDFGMGIWHG